MILLWTTLALAAPPDLDGTWALEMRITSAAKVPVLGELESVSRSWIRLTLTHDDPALTQLHESCGAEVRGGLVKTRVTDAYVAASKAKTYPATVAADGNGWSYLADIPPFQMGYDPSCPEVPTSADAPCVVDSDRDGNPGATIQAKAPMFGWVSVYVAQRNHQILRGTVESADRITGRVEVRESTNQVLGASNPLFASSPTARTVADASTFTLVRMAAGATCADVVARFTD